MGRHEMVNSGSMHREHLKYTVSIFTEITPMPLRQFIDDVLQGVA